MHRILLIDDDEQLGPPLATYFQRFGLELVQALRPSEGLALLEGQGQGGFDAAILDGRLPEMDGFALCRTIRRTSDIPIVMLTARGAELLAEVRAVKRSAIADIVADWPQEDAAVFAHLFERFMNCFETVYQQREKALGPK